MRPLPAGAGISVARPRQGLPPAPTPAYAYASRVYEFVGGLAGQECRLAPTGSMLASGIPAGLEPA